MAYVLDLLTVIDVNPSRGLQGGVTPVPLRLRKCACCLMLYRVRMRIVVASGP